ncbi:MAG: site-specific integrase, partial [Bacteroidota bacterium]
IDFANQSVTVRTLKRRRADVFRQIPLPDFLLKDLSGHLTSLENGQNQLWSFSSRSASRYVKRVMQEARITGVKASALGLRHGFAVHAVRKVPITQVQKWLGHASLQTTAIYLNVSGIEERELAELVWEN